MWFDECEPRSRPLQPRSEKRIPSSIGLLVVYVAGLATVGRTVQIGDVDRKAVCRLHSHGSTRFRLEARDRGIQNPKTGDLESRPARAILNPLAGTFE